MPLPETYSLTVRPGYLRLSARTPVIRERGQYSWLGFRQAESDFEFAAGMQFRPAVDGLEAGLVVLQRDDNYWAFTLGREQAQNVLKLTLMETGEGCTELVRVGLSDYAGEIILQVRSRSQRYRFEYSLDGGQSFAICAERAADRILSRSYTGAYLGLYATSNDQAINGYADFAWVKSTGSES